MSDKKISITTEPFYNGDIRQTVDVMGEISIIIIQTKDKQIHDALIQLGWTPPTPNKGNDNE